ncbi:MAG: SET domain-containing protein-lysine N-methyltransferase [Acidobacteriia bacterium]|nr:SET domain-containing protein-lysine N-methyltransferase [Terriglobia bacterium]
MIAIGNSPGKGRGIFARRMIRAGETIEEAPVLVFPGSQLEWIDKTIFGDYYFHWGYDEEDGALLLGLCSLCNHSYSPNARFYRKFDAGTIQFTALRDIEFGEEITVNYNEEPDDWKPMWFEVLG